MALQKCETCGALVSSKLDKCPNCGNTTFVMNTEQTLEQPKDKEQPKEAVEDKASVWLNIVSFLIPIVGCILYFAIKSPNKAKSYGKWGCIGFFVNFVITLLIS